MIVKSQLSASTSHGVGNPNNYPPTVNRACQRCSRKKIKCDMRRPSCGLCKRLGVSCTFPIRQNPYRGKPSLRLLQNASKLQCCTKETDGAEGPLNDPSRDGGCASLFRVLDSSTLMEVSQESVNSEDREEGSTKDFPSGTSGQGDSSMESSDIISLSHAEDRSYSNVQHIGHDVQSAASEFGSSVDYDNSRVNESNGWDMPDDVAVEVIDQYFANVQPWVNILHRPSFYKEYVTTAGLDARRLRSPAELGQAEVFMMNGIFSLAARFSTHPFFTAAAPLQERGRKFATNAGRIKDTIMADIAEPTLEFVKGCVFLAYHYITAGELAPGSVLTSLCVHFAYDLELDMVDMNHINDDGSSREDLLDVHAWVRREDRRRLWWAIWELDAFVATLSRQTFKINKYTEMKVFLPVADELWYSRQPIPSSVLDHHLTTAWKSLEGSPNQCPHAWCLVAKQVKSLCAVAAGHKLTNVSQTIIDEFEASVCCLQLSMPAQFQIQSLYLHRDNFVDGLWIICIHLMIVAAETLLAKLQSSDPSSVNGLAASPRVPRLKSYVTHIANVWLAEYIPLTNPIMSCALVIPATLNSQQPETPPTCLEVSTLVLSHMAKYWGLGQVVIRLLSAIKEGLSHQSKGLLSQDREMAKRFSILLPVSPASTSNDASIVAQSSHSTEDVGVPDAESQYPKNIDWSNIWDMDSFDWLFDFSDLTGPADGTRP